MDTDKDYSKWHDVKSQVNKEDNGPGFSEREIWFCALGSNIGSEQDGFGDNYLRPVLIVKKFNKESCLIVPLTKTIKDGVHYFCFSYKEGMLSNAILSQIRFVDSKRLRYKTGYISGAVFLNLKEKLKQLIA